MIRETLRLPPGRVRRISENNLAVWRGKRGGFSRANKHPVCDGPIRDDELPLSVVERVSELLKSNNWLKARVRYYDVNAAQWTAIKEYVFERDKNACVYCGGLAEHADHLIPISKFGSWHPDNVVAACGHCNCSKSNSDLEEWLEKHFR